MKKAKAILVWHLFIDCPHCGKQLDLADGEYDQDGIYSRPIFNNNWDYLKKQEVECQKSDPCY